MIPLHDPPVESGTFSYGARSRTPDQQTVRRLLDRSDYVDEHDFPLVHRIVLEMSFQSLDEELKDNPYAVFNTDGEGRTALFWAAARGKELALKTLLRHGADPCVMDKNGATPLYVAAECAEASAVRCVRILLEAGGMPDPIAPEGVPRRSPPLLCAACHSRDPLVVRTLLDFGANVNARGPDGETPLLATARSKKLPHTLLLMEYGADLDAHSNDGKTALTRATVHNNYPVLQILLDLWYMYSACPRLAAPNLLGVIAEYADVETMRIFASSEHLRLRGDRSYMLAAMASDQVRRRPDTSEELITALDELLYSFGLEQTETNSDQALEKGLVENGRGTGSLSDPDEIEVFQDAIEKIVL